MTKTSKTIVFFGSGPVARESLKFLITKFNVEAVVTKPAKTRHDDPVPVLDLANENKIKVYTPVNRSELDALIDQQPFKSEIAILVDYGIIVSQKVINNFGYGIVNSHFSLLPEWRGADPITFSILSGQNKTGVSLMLLTAEMDEGPILDQKSINLPDNITTPELTNKLIILSNDMLAKRIPEYLDNKLEPKPQSKDIVPTYSKKLSKDDGKINWGDSADQIEREIRAYISWPKSYTSLKDLEVIITQAHVVEENGNSGDFYIKDNQLIIYCGKAALSIDKIKPANKNEMDIKAFLAGYKSQIS